MCVWLEAKRYVALVVEMKGFDRPPSLSQQTLAADRVMIRR